MPLTPTPRSSALSCGKQEGAFRTLRASCTGPGASSVPLGFVPGRGRPGAVSVGSRGWARAGRRRGVGVASPGPAHQGLRPPGPPLGRARAPRLRSAEATNAARVTAAPVALSRPGHPGRPRAASPPSRARARTMPAGAGRPRSRCRSRWTWGRSGRRGRLGRGREGRWVPDAGCPRRASPDGGRGGRADART